MTEKKRKVGRPSLYKPEYCELARKYCLLGARNEDLARSFEVSIATIDKWISEIPEFSGAVKDGREDADANVCNSLYRRATGYEIDGKHIPPETTAAIFWLKNRQRDKWREKTEVDHTVNINEVRLVFVDPKAKENDEPDR